MSLAQNIVSRLNIRESAYNRIINKVERDWLSDMATFRSALALVHNDYRIIVDTIIQVIGPSDEDDVDTSKVEQLEDFLHEIHQNPAPSDMEL